MFIIKFKTLISRRICAKWSLGHGPRGHTRISCGFSKEWSDVRYDGGPLGPSCPAFNLELPRFGVVGPQYPLGRLADRLDYRRLLQLPLDALQRSLLFEFLRAEFLCHFRFLQFFVFLTTQTYNAIGSPNVRGIVCRIVLFLSAYKIRR